MVCHLSACRILLCREKIQVIHLAVSGWNVVAEITVVTHPLHHMLWIPCLLSGLNNSFFSSWAPETEEDPQWRVLMSLKNDLSPGGARRASNAHSQPPKESADPANVLREGISANHQRIIGCWFCDYRIVCSIVINPWNHLSCLPLGKWQITCMTNLPAKNIMCNQRKNSM